MSVSPHFTENLFYLACLCAALFVVTVSLHLQERWVSRFVSRRLGWNAVLLTGWLGVPCHEFSHLLVAKLFGHRIVAWKLFDPDPTTGTLGYVHHAYSKRNLWQSCGNFFIGISPMLWGGALLIAIFWWALPSSALSVLSQYLESRPSTTLHPFSLEHLVALFRNGISFVGACLSLLWQHRSGWLLVQLYLAICIACHLAPSRADLRSGFVGGILTLGIATIGIYFASSANLSLARVLVPLPLVVSIVIAVALFQSSYVAVVAIATRNRVTHSIR